MDMIDINENNWSPKYWWDYKWFKNAKTKEGMGFEGIGEMGNELNWSLEYVKDIVLIICKQQWIQ